MNREVHVQFWEGVGLRCPALLTYLKAYESVAEARSAIGGYLAFTIPADLIRALNGGRRIRPTSTGYRRSRRHEPGRCSTYQPENPVQINQASSISKMGRRR